jgi:hypothetical protein
LFVSVCSSTQPPLHAVYPVLQAHVHPPAEHTGRAWAMLVVHAFPQVPQLPTLLVVSTQEPPQSESAGVAAGQPDVQAQPAPERAQTGVPPEHTVPHAPQFFVWLRSVSHPSAALALQFAQSAAHAANEHSPAVHSGPLACGRSVQSLVHVPQ